MAAMLSGARRLTYSHVTARGCGEPSCRQLGSHASRAPLTPRSASVNLQDAMLSIFV